MTAARLALRVVCFLSRRLLTAECWLERKTAEEKP